MAADARYFQVALAERQRAEKEQLEARLVEERTSNLFQIKQLGSWKICIDQARRELSLEDKDWRKFGLEEKEGLGYALEFLCDCANDERDFTLDMAQKVLRRLIGDEKDD